MFGKASVDATTLNVYVGKTKIFTISGNQGNVWRQAKVNVPVTSCDSKVGKSILPLNY